jgi:hypothetical protein
MSDARMTSTGHAVSDARWLDLHFQVWRLGGCVGASRGCERGEVNSGLRIRPFRPAYNQAEPRELCSVAIKALPQITRPVRETSQVIALALESAERSIPSSHWEF